MRKTRQKLEAKTGKDSLGYKLWQVTHGWQRQLEKGLEPLGLTHLQFVLLAATAWLSEHESAPSQARLSEFTRFDRMMISKVVRLLESRKLLSRSVDPLRIRRYRVTLTAEGRALLKRAFPIYARVNHSFFGRLKDRVAVFHDLLDEFLEES